jgi:hypothetical protein
MSLFFALVVGAFQYSKISQSFGGGRPEKVIVFLKPGEATNLPVQTILDGKMVDLLFRRGSKFGFRLGDTNDGQILVIDQSQIDHLYVGRKIQEFDLKKLK